MKRAVKQRLGWKRFGICLLLVLTTMAGFAQEDYRKYTVRNGRMYIELHRDIRESSLDSFIRQFNLFELGLKSFLQSGLADSLSFMGWKIEVNNETGIVISKPLLPPETMNAADKILFSE